MKSPLASELSKSLSSSFKIGGKLSLLRSWKVRLEGSRSVLGGSLSRYSRTRERIPPAGSVKDDSLDYLGLPDKNTNKHYKRFFIRHVYAPVRNLFVERKKTQEQVNQSSVEALDVFQGIVHFIYSATESILSASTNEGDKEHISPGKRKKKKKKKKKKLRNPSEKTAYTDDSEEFKTPEPEKVDSASFLSDLKLKDTKVLSSILLSKKGDLVKLLQYAAPGTFSTISKSMSPVHEISKLLKEAMHYAYIKQDINTYVACAELFEFTTTVVSIVIGSVALNRKQRKVMNDRLKALQDSAAAKRSQAKQEQQKQEA